MTLNQCIIRSPSSPSMLISRCEGLKKLGWIMSNLDSSRFSVKFLPGKLNSLADVLSLRKNVFQKATNVREEGEEVKHIRALSDVEAQKVRDSRVAYGEAHWGITKTWRILQKNNPQISRDDAARVVEYCKIWKRFLSLVTRFFLSKCLQSLRGQGDSQFGLCGTHQASG